MTVELLATLLGIAAGTLVLAAWILKLFESLYDRLNYLEIKLNENFLGVDGIARLLARVYPDLPDEIPYGEDEEEKEEKRLHFDEIDLDNENEQESWGQIEGLKQRVGRR